MNQRRTCKRYSREFKEEAVADYDEAIRLNPNDDDAYNNRGIVKANLGQHEEAIADFDEAIRLNPNYAKAYSNRGIVKASLGQYLSLIHI